MYGTTVCNGTVVDVIWCEGAAKMSMECAEQTKNTKNGPDLKSGDSSTLTAEPLPCKTYISEKYKGKIKFIGKQERRCDQKEILRDYSH